MTSTRGIRRPAPRPCEFCPYRLDAPSGLWDASEYDKLPDYDNETGAQPFTVFLCHQQDGRVCAGWAGCHDGLHLLGLRVAVSIGEMSETERDATIAYQSPVPLFATGAEAAAHGMVDIAAPGLVARRAAAKLRRLIARRAERAT